ncbi:MAG: 50S ribosomal protein L4 [Patescibacteria group bacterium]|nr:50S ribosomal protein L4 [Patescibacteria group bacterium]
MKINVYNQAGEIIGEENLPEDIFGVKLNQDLVHQVSVSQTANRRQGNSDAKDRAEVRGGGKKPWRQKGTGRSRHGSIRSPLWKGGGVTFGPQKERNYKKTIPAKMRKKALLMVLSEKARGKFLLVVDKLSAEKPKTKFVADTLKNLPTGGKTVLIVLPAMDKNLILSARNIAKTSAAQAKDLNALDVLSFRYLVMPKESIGVIVETFGPKEPKN